MLTNFSDVSPQKGAKHYHHPVPLVAYLAIFLGLLPGTNALPLSCLTLNVTEWGSAVKTQSVIDLLSKYLPHIFILTETVIHDGPNHIVRDTLGCIYNFFTTPRGQRGHVGGITIGVHKSIQAMQTSIIPDKWQKHLCAVSLMLPEGNMRSTLTPTKIIAIYAPQSSDRSLPDYWNTVKSVIPPNGRWIAMGDMNACLSQREYTGKYRPCQHPMRTFLNETAGSDAWSLVADCDVSVSYTNRMNQGDQHAPALSILDRALVGPNLPNGPIFTLKDYIPFTTHRAVMIRIPIPATATATWEMRNGSSLRLWKPQPAEVPLKTVQLDASLRDHISDSAFAQTIRTDADYDAKWTHISNAFTTACKRVFPGPPDKHGYWEQGLQRRRI